jgi:hypothetical protein
MKGLNGANGDNRKYDEALMLFVYMGWIELVSRMDVMS